MLGALPTKPAIFEAFGCVCSIAGGPDLDCEVLDMRPGELTVRVPGRTRAGDRILLSLPALGLVEGHVLRGTGDIYVVALASGRMLQAARIEGYLEAVSRAPFADSREQRRHKRYVPLQRLVQIEAGHERSHIARIIDVSQSGVAVTCMATIYPEARVRVGSTKGKVVRVLEGGYAIAFDEALDDAIDVTLRL